MQRQRWCVAVFVVVAILCLAGAAGAAMPWPLAQGMVDLGSLDPPGSGDAWSNWSHAYGINDLGQVVGQTGVTGVPNNQGIHAFLWTKAGGMQDLGIPPNGDPNDATVAYGINNAGAIIVTKNFYWGPDESAWKNTNGSWLKLGQFSNNWTVGYAINQNGEAAGQAWSPDLYHPEGSWGWFACKWSAVGEILDLGQLSGGGGSEALSINGIGHVAGDSRTGGSGVIHAVVWTGPAPDGITDLGALLESDPNPSNWKVYSYATGINDNGAVVGYYQGPTTLYGGKERAFLWTPGGGMVDLGTLPDGTTSHATAINNQGQVTGWSYGFWQNGGTLWGLTHAFLWANGKMRDLGTMGSSSTDPLWYWSHTSRGFAINQLGQVAGMGDGKDANGIDFTDHGFFSDPKWPIGVGSIMLLLN